ncbi:ankyrin repeat domain-containing protein [Stenotrophomonas acidaminiphila]
MGLIRNWEEGIQALFTGYDACANDDSFDPYRLIRAAKEGDISMIEFQINSAKNSCGYVEAKLALDAAIENRHFDCVKLLIPHFSDGIALIASAKCGFFDDLKRLISLQDVSAIGAEIYIRDALLEALRLEQVDCVKLLIPHVDVDWVIYMLSKISSEKNMLGMRMLNLVLAEMQKERLSDAVGLDDLAEQAPVKKRRM